MTKHIDVKHHVVGEKVITKEVYLKYKLTKEMVAFEWTKESKLFEGSVDGKNSLIKNHIQEAY
jgi:hypothetical protein